MLKLLKISILGLLVLFSNNNLYSGGYGVIGSYRGIKPDNHANASGLNQMFDTRGRYIFGYAGMGMGSDYNFLSTYPGYPEIKSEYEYDDGLNAGFGVGFYSGLFEGSRFELEYSFIENDFSGELKQSILTAEGGRDASSTHKANMFMINAFKEIPLNDTFTFYLGGGIGYASVDLEAGTPSELIGTYIPAPGAEVDAKTSGLAYQFILGVDMPISERLMLFTQYKYLILPEFSDESESTYLDTGEGSYSAEDSAKSSSFQIGIRSEF